jgi:hypothetical protein
MHSGGCTGSQDTCNTCVFNNGTTVHKDSHELLKQIAKERHFCEAITLAMGDCMQLGSRLYARVFP